MAPRIDSCVHFQGIDQECGTWYCSLKRHAIDVSCEGCECDGCDYYRVRTDDGHTYRRLF